ncbi:MAG: transcriptional regulator [Candidatus Marinimicrobia bacterium]|nr:transcriptional regulator [Candidatus Neomarinimicrobiota bacterium]
MSVTKKDLANNISKKLRLSKKDSLFLVQNFFDSLIENKNKHINLSNFGSFIFKKTPSRIGRNPKTLQEFKIKSRQKLTFRPSDEVKQNIN